MQVGGTAEAPNSNSTDLVFGPPESEAHGKNFRKDAALAGTPGPARAFDAQPTGADGIFLPSKDASFVTSGHPLVAAIQQANQEEGVSHLNPKGLRGSYDQNAATMGGASVAPATVDAQTRLVPAGPPEVVARNAAVGEQKAAVGEQNEGLVATATDAISHTAETVVGAVKSAAQTAADAASSAAHSAVETVKSVTPGLATPQQDSVSTSGVGGEHLVPTEVEKRPLEESRNVIPGAHILSTWEAEELGKPQAGSEQRSATGGSGDLSSEGQQEEGVVTQTAKQAATAVSTATTSAAHTVADTLRATDVVVTSAAASAARAAAEAVRAAAATASSALHTDGEGQSGEASYTGTENGSTRQSRSGIPAQALEEVDEVEGMEALRAWEAQNVTPKAAHNLESVAAPFSAGALQPVGALHAAQVAEALPVEHVFRPVSDAERKVPTTYSEGFDNRGAPGGPITSTGAPITHKAAQDSKSASGGPITGTGASQATDPVSVPGVAKEKARLYWIPHAFMAALAAVVVVPFLISATIGVQNMGFFWQLVLGTISGAALAALFSEVARHKHHMREQQAVDIASMNRIDLPGLRALLGENVPKYLNFPEFEQVKFLNANLRELWPNLNKAASAMIKEQLTPILEQYRPAILEKMKIKKLTLGNDAPIITGVRVRDHKDKDEIVLDIKVDWRKGKPNFYLDVNPVLAPGILVKVKDIDFAGWFRLSFKPLTGKAIPSFGAVMLSLEEEPLIDLTVKIMGGLMLIPGIDAMLDNTIKTAVVDTLLWPNRMVFPIIPGDYKDLEFRPSGVLTVTLLKATNLMNTDVIGKSDPFCYLYVRKLTDRIKRSTTKKNNLNPVWNETFEIPVEDPKWQHLTIQCLDEEARGQAEMIGQALVHLKKVPVGQVVEIKADLLAEVGKDAAAAKNKHRGEIYIRMKWDPYVKGQEPWRKEEEAKEREEAAKMAAGRV